MKLNMIKIVNFKSVGEKGSKTSREITDYRLSRYACDLIVLNCDPRRK